MTYRVLTDTDKEYINLTFEQLLSKPDYIKKKLSSSIFRHGEETACLESEKGTA